MDPNTLFLLLTVFYYIVGAVTMLLASAVHEYAHALSAKKLGDYTAEAEGRLTLNPLKHVDPIGLLSMIFFRIGWSKPVPVNHYNFKNPVTGLALVSLAGPLSNLILALILGLSFRIFLSFLSPDSILAATLYDIGAIMIAVNIALAVFNLIPIPPLDGFSILEALVPKQFRYYLSIIEPYGFIIILVLVLPFSPLSGLFSQLFSTIIQAGTDLLLGN